jgi:hypothetical protein
MSHPVFIVATRGACFPYRRVAKMGPAVRTFCVSGGTRTPTPRAGLVATFNVAA